MSAHVVKREGNTYHFEGTAGSTIKESIKETIDFLKRYNGTDEVVGILMCNGVTLNLKYNDDVELAYLVYKKVSDDNAKTWRESEEGKTYAQDVENRKQSAQEKINDLVNRIRPRLADYAAVWGASKIQPHGEDACFLMALLAEYIELADHTGIERHTEEMIKLLENAGYKENEFTISGDGQKPSKQYETRAWFVGQMINMMKSSMGCAHPGLASMVGKYKLHLNP